MNTVLLIEDDEISLRFMAEAILLLPVQLHTCNCFEDASKLLLLHDINLIISDINLGDGNLYQAVQTFPTVIKKIAISAELTPSIISRLKAVGIDNVLSKPMRIAELHHTINTALDLLNNPVSGLPLWDTEKALLALGNNLDSLNTLKNMFRAELPIMMQQINQDFITGNHLKISDILHKLKASCGFLGAHQLLAECHALDSDICQDTLQQFQRIANQTLNSI